MAGETIRTKALTLAIWPWSRTSHVVTWLTPGIGALTTLVKGAVRPKSFFLGQYDVGYTCEIVYYATARGDVHILKEVSPIYIREYLRDNWRAALLASYACSLAKDFAPAGADSGEFFRFLSGYLDSLTNIDSPKCAFASMIRFEVGVLRLAGLSPDFSGAEIKDGRFQFAIDKGRAGNGTRTISLSPQGVDALNGLDGDVEEALRFLGLFFSYHAERPTHRRRSLVNSLR